MLTLAEIILISSFCSNLLIPQGNCFNDIVDCAHDDIYTVKQCVEDYANNPGDYLDDNTKWQMFLDSIE